MYQKISTTILFAFICSFFVLIVIEISARERIAVPKFVNSCQAECFEITTRLNSDAIACDKNNIEKKVVWLNENFKKPKNEQDDKKALKYISDFNIICPNTLHSYL